MGIETGRAITGGIVGTAVMTAVGIWGAPLMGIPPMNPAVMLAGVMGGGLALGWVAHFTIGTILALAYALVAPSLAGPPPLRGVVYAMGPFLMAQALVMPMMGMPFFSGSIPMAAGSLVGHLMFGAVLGAIYGPVTARSAHRKLSTAP